MAAFAGEDQDAKMCRYCFGGDEDGELIESPCKCTGSQKFVHPACLQRWQRMVLVSQPTHPAFYKDELRFRKCTVCLADYSGTPPSRLDLMASFTGPEIAALIEKDFLIVARDLFSEKLESIG